MKKFCILAAIAVCMATSAIVWSADSGAALYDSKCSMCHGEKGEGNPGGGIPALKGTAMTAEKLVTYVTKGDKTKTIHAEPVGDLNDDQAKALAEFIKKMK
jgi:cytochrome c553